MRTIATLTLLIVGALTALTALPVFAADSPEERAIDARQGMMHIRAFNVAPLIGMLKGDIPYDAARASKLANNLKAMLEMDMGGAWVKGTSNKAYPDDTEALPAIWSADSEFSDRGQAYAKAVMELAAVAGNGRNALAPATKDLAQSCKSCHDDYREDD